MKLLLANILSHTVAQASPTFYFASIMRFLLIVRSSLIGGCLIISSSWAQEPPDDRPGQTAVAGNDQVRKIIESFTPRGVQADDSEPTAPEHSIATFRMLDGTAIDLVSSEPSVSQPLYISWDSQGRMWVVQYRQYQYPAGLKVVRFDHHLRAVFDKTPAAPPNHIEGKDCITVFEDTNHDGLYDRSEEVISGLNIATSVAIGDGGIWVLNPPYLLRYPDEDNDTRPDGPPEVHLEGFGIQDTHAVANSLMWGPDGWLYGANGSTTTGSVSSRVTAKVQFEGQCIWRYHPVTSEFEIYAEGGGNTFSLEIDSKGRVFSGTNGGDTRGWYYPQGSYSHKNWGKHGPLTNPFAFGYFNPMRFEGDGRRFPQAFAIYEGGLFDSQQFDGTIVAPNAMQNLIWQSQRLRDGSTFKTIDNANLLESSDRWFRPVYCGVGPDGAVYVADWYDTRLSHVSPTDDWHKTSGRIYRIRPEGKSPIYEEGNLATSSDRALISLMENHPNKWVRRRACLELGWRTNWNDATLPQLKELAKQKHLLEAVWAMSISRRLPPSLYGELLQSSSPDIRRWCVRLLGDTHTEHHGLLPMAAAEQDVEVRSQLAATARRLSPEIGLQIAAELVLRDDDLQDPHMPLMIWWAIESHADSWNALKQHIVANPKVWRSPIFKQHIASRLIRRFASEGTMAGLKRCEEILQTIDDNTLHPNLLDGLNQAYQGSSLPPLPKTLAKALSEYHKRLPGQGIVMAMRQRTDTVLREALTKLEDPSTDTVLRIEIAKAFGDIYFEDASQTLLRLATRIGNSAALQRVAIQSLANYDSPEIPTQLTRALDSQIADQHGMRDACCRTLASRRDWALALLIEINQWRLQSTQIPPDVVQRLRTYTDTAIQAEVVRAFGPATSISSENQIVEIARLTKLINQKVASDAVAGKSLFAQHCGTCHLLFGEGAKIGPPLDNYDRGNLKFWLPAIVAPSLEIREGFQSYAILLNSGRVLTGMLETQDLQTLTIRTADNRSIATPRSEVDEMHPIATSLMPERILNQLNDQQIRDLFAYLRSNLGPPKPPASHEVDLR